MHDHDFLSKYFFDLGNSQNDKLLVSKRNIDIFCYKLDAFYIHNVKLHELPCFLFFLTSSPFGDIFNFAVAVVSHSNCQVRENQKSRQVKPWHN